MKLPLASLVLSYSLSSGSAFFIGETRSRGWTVVRQATKASDTPLFIDATGDADSTRASVSDYYGQTLQTSEDLKTNACCTAGAPPKHIQDCLDNINPEVIAKYYGCGLCIPDILEGTTVLDLGCGAGRDVYIASQLVGKEGKVIGVDMTEEQLAVAKKHVDYHTEKFGYGNVEFHQGLIEKLEDITSLEDNSVDVIISNCVINLCPDKTSVLENCHRLLKPGGELYFSDVYANRRVPEKLQKDEVMWGECLSGALYWNDFQNLAKKCGFADPRLVEDSVITVNSAEVEDTINKSGNSDLKFFSATYRLFKIDELEPFCEDYGQAVIYKGTIPRFESGYSLDNHHYMETGKIFPVCGNTYRMLNDTRFKDHFEFIGNWDKHYGIFDGCGTSIPFASATEGATTGVKGGGGGCC
eukprot:CAMPEP_0178945840 /NCGR_PEP_ID=MMETSP0789-20121207/3952_1 /TAXON_ID=3005 /ORGANISM="Rhizosolenia setigera, Strain CCMP 1694" /LENGTH=412 /DNA_ID=CAMNT_0020625763 /DNA_START=33 /DNA_END=1271 /DNA_ORIENTATION=-